MTIEMEMESNFNEIEFQTQSPVEDPVLSIKHLNKTLGAKQILTDITFDVGKGEIFGFLGPNGSGKTTTIKLILGLLNIESGSISICGKDVSKNFEEAIASVGGIIENPEMYKYLSGRQNLDVYRRMYKDIPKERIDELASLVGLSARIDDKISKYSLGMRQRLGVAQALINDPALLVLDEPTNGLDPEGIKEFRDTLITLAHEKGKTIFISSHLLSELDQLCDRVGIVENGHVVDIRTMSEVRDVKNDEGLSLYAFSVEDRDAAEKIITDAGFGICEDKKTHEHLVTVKEERAKEVAKLLALADVGFTGLVKKERTLEDAFLEITKNKTASYAQIKNDSDNNETEAETENADAVAESDSEGEGGDRE